MAHSWTGFHRLPAEQRMRRLAQAARLDASDVAALTATSALPSHLAQAFVENAVGTFPVPLGVAVGFVVDGREALVPMAVEESSVIAAACHGAKLARLGGGFTTSLHGQATLGQVEVRDVPDPERAARRVRRQAASWRRELDALIPKMVARGGGVRRIEPRILPGRLVVHLHVDTRDAMGANVVNTLCEWLSPRLVDAVGGRPGLRILSNLAVQRVVTATCNVPFSALAGDKGSSHEKTARGKLVAQAIVEADEFARVDPFRAATHNKGILNGMDPVALATGNDWRALEAGAHAYAARTGSYQGLTRWRLGRGRLVGRLEVPVSVGTVGGVTSLHPTAAAGLRLLGAPDAARLARIIASVGLAQNLAALRALATEGIQAGHMALHASNVALRARGRTAPRRTGAEGRRTPSKTRTSRKS